MAKMWCPEVTLRHTLLCVPPHRRLIPLRHRFCLLSDTCHVQVLVTLADNMKLSLHFRDQRDSRELLIIK